MKIGLLGFPGAGKTTLFRILTGAPEPHPAGARGPAAAIGVAHVPDPRLERIAALFHPQKVTPATVEFLDPVETAAPARGDALPYQGIRDADGFLHVIRAFPEPGGEGGADPLRDVRRMEADLLLADLAVAEKRVEKLASSLRKNPNPDDEAEREVLQRVRAGLEEERPVRSLGLRPEERKRLRGFAFLTERPILGVLNLPEGETAALEDAPARFGLVPAVASLHAAFCAVSAKIELEVAQLDSADAEAFRGELGIRAPCSERVIESAWGVLDQATFFTHVQGEVRAWNVEKHAPAHRAAGRVHSDMERGFIRAEVIAFDDLVAAGSLAAARERGTLRTEGKDYPVADGDVITFRFHV